MKFNSLKDAIPKQWRNILKTQPEVNIPVPLEAPPTIIIKNENISILKLKNKDLYGILIENKQCPPIIKNKWATKLETNINDKDWETIFTLPRVVKDTKLRAFQYKVLFNLIICKSYLHKIGKAATNLCDKCNQPDTLTHFLYECNETTNFWTNLSRWWNNITQEQIIFTKKDAILGLLNESDTLNACVLFAKWFIYREKINNRNTFFYKFQYELKYRLAAEKIIAINNNKLENYYSNWRIVEQDLENL
jgi:hypothetical protein